MSALRLAAALLAFALAAPLVAKPTVNVSLEPTSVTLGDRIAATIVVKLDADDRRVPRLPDWSGGWGKLSVLSAPEPQRIETGAGIEWRQPLQLAAFELGTIALPPVEIAVGDGDDSPRLVTPGDLAVEVRSVLPAETKEVQPMPAEPPRALRLPRAFWWSAAALIVASVLAGIATARRKRGAGAGSRAALSPLAELERVLASLTASEPGAGLTALSLALRRYLGRSLSLPAAESTTSELAQRLGGRTLDRATVQRTVKLLREVDQVKFARRIATGFELGQRLDETRALVVDVERQLAPPPLAATGGSAPLSPPPGTPPPAPTRSAA